MTTLLRRTALLAALGTLALPLAAQYSPAPLKVALGVRSVNPKAEVKGVWLNTWLACGAPLQHAPQRRLVRHAQLEIALLQIAADGGG